MSTNHLQSEIRNPKSEIGESAIRNPHSAIKALVRQIVAVFLLSLRRLLRSKFLSAIITLGAIPVAIACLIALSGRPMHQQNVGRIQDVHALLEGFLRFLYLHFIVFFGANVLGFAVMRQEYDDQTLHYLFLQPVPRWMLVVGKAVAFVVLASAVCVTSLWVTYLIMTLPRFGLAAVIADLFGKGRFVILAKESLVIALGLLAYGSIAMLMGSLFKSGFYALILLAWESGLPYLPSTLKLWTVMHYLQSLLPERHTDLNRLFALLGEPASVWLSLAVIGGVSGVFIAACAFFYQFRECLYAEA